MKKASSDDWRKEYSEFIKVEPISPPGELSAAILTHVEGDLNPSFFRLVVKVGLIQAVVGAFTLLFCPQFNFGPLEGAGLAGVFMHNFGLLGCRLACGITFVGAGFLVSGFALNLDEIRFVRKRLVSVVSLVVLMSLGVFVCTLGLKLIEDLTLVWAVGAFAGGLASFEFGSLLKNKIYGAGNVKLL